MSKKPAPAPKKMPPPKPVKETKPVKEIQTIHSHEIAKLESVIPFLTPEPEPTPSGAFPFEPVVTPIVNSEDPMTSIAEATRADGFTYRADHVLASINPAFIEFNPQYRNSQNEIAVKATNEGLSYADSLVESKSYMFTPQVQPSVAAHNPPALQAEQAVKSATSFVIEDIPLPASSPRVARSAYPFEHLNVGQSFFVPTDGKKKLSASVSNANKRYAPKHFRSVTVEGGVRIGRTE